MEISIVYKKVNKVVPLRISGEVECHAEVAILKISHNGVCGLGEVVPFSFYNIDNSWDALEKWLEKLDDFKKFSPLQRYLIEEKLLQLNAPMAVRAGVDMALHDWLGKVTALPLYNLFGLEGMLYPDTSLTIGIGSPKDSVDRMKSWKKRGTTRLWKIKLGSLDGLDADKEMFVALAKQVEGTSAKMYVDANGGWTEKDALHMGEWLKKFGVLFIEQPLARGEEKKLAGLSEVSPIPIYADESCLHSQDMQDLVIGAKAGCHGINIKLTKCGGISEALRMITLARHHNLKVMLGCFSNTILGNSAAAHISSLVDYVDLDSHLNLKDDPFTKGAEWIDGRLIPNKDPGLGVELSNEGG